MTKPLNPQDKIAWARVARTVKPIAGRGEVSPEDLLDMQTAYAALGVESISGDGVPDPARPRGPSKVFVPKKEIGGPANRANEKRVRRGRTEVSATFDLHGHTQASAAKALPVFLSNQRDVGARCVLVITGKGRLGEGVLKRNFLSWIATAAAKPLVSGYAEAHRKHGGSGAFYVFLRKLS